MPTTITSPSGRAYRWDKVTPPTEEDFRALQAYDAAQQSDKSFLDTAIPTALRVGGAIGGAALGIPGGPVGIMAGGAAGSALGEYLAQRHQGTPLNLTQIGVQGALGAIPIGKAAGTIGKIALRRARVGALQGGVGAGLTESAETGQLPSLGTVATGTGFGTILGGSLGAVEGRALRRMGRLTPAGAPAVGASVSDIGTPPVIGGTPSPSVAGTVAEGAVPPAGTRVTPVTPVATKPLAGSRVRKPRRVPFSETAARKDRARIDEAIENRTEFLSDSDRVLTRSILRENEYYHAQRGTETLAETAEIADEIIAHGRVSQTVQPLAAQNQAQARIAYGAVGRIRTAVDQKMAQDPRITSVHMLSDPDKAELLKVLREVEASVGVAQQNASEVARALRNQREIVHAMRSSDERFLRDAVKSGATALDAIDGMRTLTTDLDRYRFIRDLAKPTKQDWWRWYYLSGLLSAPRTQLVNAISTATKVTMDVTAPFLHYNPAIARLEGMSSLAGARQGLNEGWKKAAFMFHNGFSTEHVIRNVDLPTEVTIGGRRTLTNVISRSMQASDEFFRNIAAESAAYRWAYKRAYASGQTYGSKTFNKTVADTLADRPEALIREMEEAGRMATFRQTAGPVTRSIKDLRRAGDKAGARFGDMVEDMTGSRVLGTIASVPIGTFIAPFVQTPANLLRAGIDYSPVGALRGLRRAINGGDKRLLQQGIAGTIATTGLALIAQDEKLTGAPPDDPKEREQWYAEGKQPMSIKIGGSWYGYEATPLALQLGVVANAYDGYRRARKEGRTMGAGDAAEVVWRLGKSLLQPGYLSGVMTLQQAVNDPSIYGTRYWGRALSSLIPASSLLRSATRVVDPTVRDAETVLDYVKKGVPGLSSSVLPRLDYEGEEIVVPGGVLNRGINPYRRSPETRDPLRLALQGTGARLSRPDTKLGRLPLTPVESKDVERRLGRAQAASMRKVIADPRFEGATQESQVGILTREAQKARDRARLSMSRGLIEQLEEQVREANRADPDPDRIAARWNEFYTSLPR